MNARPLLLAVLFCCAVNAARAERRDYDQNIRPILSKHCFRCHGFDEKSREADLRLDIRAAAIADRDGGPAIVPGKPDASRLIQRIDAANPDERMPPPDSNTQLTERERQTIRDWIAGGADYSALWSLVPPRWPAVPAVRHTAWPRNEIDPFVLARLESESLGPSIEAGRETLLRRVSLDLLGLPPTLEQIDAFVGDPDPGAYERIVDEMLASPRFGERMALEWLDLARYADTNGYFGDKPRSAWLWRDWVIGAFNSNMPFDQFTIEQLAGDLLPNATIDQRIATGFNRNHMANNESGLIDEEYRVEYVADRLETTSTVWLGLTVGCARCHDHKFDPISQRDYYRMFAIFNNGPETGLITQENPPPVIEVPSPEQSARLEELVRHEQEAREKFEPIKQSLRKQIETWSATASAELGQPPADSVVYLPFDDHVEGQTLGTAIDYERGVLGRAAGFDGTQHMELKPDFDFDNPWTIAVWLQAENSLGCIFSKIEPEGDRRGFEMLWQKGRLYVHLVHVWGVRSLDVSTAEAMVGRKWQHVVVRYDGSRKASGLEFFINGKRASTTVDLDTLDGTIQTSEPLRIARRDSGLGFYGKLDELRILPRAVTVEEIEKWHSSERIRGILSEPADARPAAEQEVLLDYFIDHHASAESQAMRREVVASEHAVLDLRAAIPTALVMQESETPRTTSILSRGQYDQPGEKVEAGVPSALSAWPDGIPENRLGLARWLLTPSNPLTARVAVNRLWRQCFGEGLVRTASDFGSQGESPTHAELLDWLAMKFIESGWDQKAILRKIVTSATYRQSSAATAELLERDAENRLLARGPRFRLAGETIRDQALAASGLLVDRIGGPSVKPYQPPGLWEAVSYNGEETYVPETGPGRFRRSLYTYWKRQSPPPDLLAFDAPTREKCVVRRAQTNTPLQAMVLLNDATYLEAARELAVCVLEGPGTDEQRLTSAFRRVTSRRPDQAELAVLSDLLSKQRTRRKSAENSSKETVLTSGSAGVNRIEPAELVAWTVTLHTLLNLDETVTRR